MANYQTPPASEGMYMHGVCYVCAHDSAVSHMYLLFYSGLNMSGVHQQHTQSTNFLSPAQIDPFYTQGCV